jgi:hypothetical protein
MSHVAWQTDVIDQDTGKKVGFVEEERSPAARHISLFGGKYQGDFTTWGQCDAFAKGVEAVLSHLTAVDEEQENSEVALPEELASPEPPPPPPDEPQPFRRRF